MRLTFTVYCRLFACFMLLSVMPTAGWTAPQNAEVHDVLIVGGGIAGLTAAWILDDEDLDLLVIEKENHPGGRAVSGHHQGVTYAKGAEYLGPPEGLLADMLATRELNVAEIAFPADLLFDQKQIHVGELGRARLLANQSSLAELQRFIGSLNEAAGHLEAAAEHPERPLSGTAARLDNLTAEEWLQEQKVSKVYHHFAVSFARGLFGADLAEISAATLIGELAFDFGEIGELQDEDDLVEEFGDEQRTGVYAPSGGLAEIPVSLAKGLAPRVVYGHTVTSVSRRGETFEVRCRKADQSEILLRSRAVILATPAPVSLGIAADCLSEQQRDLLATVRYSPYITVALFSRSPIFNRGFNLGVLGDFRFTDIYDGSWVWRHSAGNNQPQPAWVTLVYVAPYSAGESQLLDIPEHELLEQIKGDLEQVLPGTSTLVTGYEITRFRYGYPVMAPGSGERMRQLAATDGQGLVLAGDYLLNPTFEAAVDSGETAAEQVLDWLSEKLLK